MPLDRFLGRKNGLGSGLFGKWLGAPGESVELDSTDTLVLDVLQPAEGERLLVLDATSSALSRALAHACGPSGRVTVAPGPSCAERLGEEMRAEIAAGRVRLEDESVSSCPGAESEFQGACSRNGPYVWHRAHAMAAELGRVLSPGARLVVALDPPASPARQRISAASRPALDRIDIRRILESEGLRVLRSETACTAEGDVHVMLAVRVP